MIKIMKRKAVDMLGDAARWEELHEKYPGKRPATVEEVADLCAFLASPPSGLHSRGTIVTIDGGIARAWLGDLERIDRRAPRGRSDAAAASL